MIREFKNVNGITYEIIAENTELDRTLLREWTNNDTPCTSWHGVLIISVIIGLRVTISLMISRRLAII